MACATAIAEPSLEDLSSALRASGLTVRQGSAAFFQTSDCASLPNCFGNNPASPYAFAYVPAGPGQPMPIPCDGGPANGDDPSACFRFRLRPDEAVVWFGVTPPPCDYFSFSAYLYSRSDARGRKSILFSSLGDALNHTALHTSGPNGDPFGRGFVVIATPNRALDRQVRTVLAARGVSPSVMNTLVIPSRLPLRMGLGADADDFVLFYRVAGFANASSGAQYLAGSPGLVLRLTPSRAGGGDPFPTPRRRVRGTGVSEERLLPGLTGAMRQLERSVRARHTTMEVKRLVTIPATFLRGDFCIEKGFNCLGDVSDTTYTIGALGAKLEDRPDEFILVLGVNHALLGKASYVSLAPYNLKRLLGVDAVNDGELVGSARAYIPASPYRDVLYAYKISRNCNGDPDCLEVGEDFPGVPLGDPISVVERAYLEPATGIGPSYEEVIPPVFLHVRPR